MKAIAKLISEDAKHEFPNGNVSHYKRDAKLFAVTQDITQSKREKVGEWKGNPIIGDLYRTETEAFVILGELSPDAHWVKDGDEIDVAQEYIEEGISYFYEEMDCTLPGIEKELAVKCPTCNTYH